MYFYSNLISSWFDCSVLFFHPPLFLYLFISTNERRKINIFSACYAWHEKLSRRRWRWSSSNLHQLIKVHLIFINFIFLRARSMCRLWQRVERKREKKWNENFLWKFHYWKRRQNALERSDTTEKSALTRGKFFFSFFYIICCLQLEKFHFSRVRALV